MYGWICNFKVTVGTLMHLLQWSAFAEFTRKFLLPKYIIILQGTPDILGLDRLLKYFQRPYQHPTFQKFILGLYKSFSIADKDKILPAVGRCCFLIGCCPSMIRRRSFPSYQRQGGFPLLPARHHEGANHPLHSVAVSLIKPIACMMYLYSRCLCTF